MNKNPLVSIILPIYKVERYLPQCVDSVLGQTYRNIEILLVDDGSPDNCPQICDEYAKKDNRIVVIHKPNGGLSDARNAGTEVATGKYIFYLDSDDYLVKDTAVEQLVEIAEQNPEKDIVYLRRAYFHDEDGVFYRNTLNGLKNEVLSNMTSEEQVAYLVENNYFVAAAHQKLIKAKVLKENGIVFTKGLLSEDVDWNFELMLHANGIAVCEDILYAYRMRKGSITKSLGQKNIDDQLWILEKWINKLEGTNSIDDNLKYSLLSYLAYQYVLSLVVAGKVLIKNGTLPIETIVRFKSLKRLLKYRGCKKVRWVSPAIKLFGVKSSMKVLAWYHTNR